MVLLSALGAPSQIGPTVQEEVAPRVEPLHLAPADLLSLLLAPTNFSHKGDRGTPNDWNEMPKLPPIKLDR